LALLSGPAPAQETSPTKTFFLPTNRVAATYVLGRLSNAELIAAPRGEFVYEALVQRKGISGKYRLEALDGLSRLHKTSPVVELLAVMPQLDRKGEPAAETLRELTPLVLQNTPRDLASQRPVLIRLATDSQLPLTRQIAYAACLTGDGSPEPLWSELATKPAQLVDLLYAVPLLSPAMRAEFYSKIEPLAHQTTAPAVQRAAMTALASSPGHETDAFQTLAGIFQAGTERDAAVAALLSIPQKFRAKDLAPGLAAQVLEFLRSVPAEERTSASFSNALLLASDLASLLSEEAGKALTRELRGLGPALVTLHAVYEQMRFDQQLIVVESGKPVSITLQNDDAMPHNLAIVKPGKLEEVGLAAEKMPAEPDSDGRLYVPNSPDVLFATKMIPPGQQGRLAFAAPIETGEYPFVCTFPGHWRRMSGVIAVVTNVEAYLASHEQSQRPRITEWKLADLAADLATVSPGRNLDSGKEFFSKLACVQCHRLDGQGYAFGPDLSDVFTRYKNERAAVLQQILEPSKIIDPRYRNVNFEIKNDEPVTGMVLKEDAETVTVHTGPADSLIRTLKKADILQRRPQESSPMPVGLLNSLSKEQILDLLGYIESGGKTVHHAHGETGRMIRAE